MNRIFIILVVSSFLLTSCAYHIGTMTGSASISNSNFQIVDFAIGTSQTTKVFGIGGLKSESLILDAKRDLYINYPLKKGQALSNITVDFCRKNYIVFATNKATISAEIIDFNNDESSIPYDEVYQKLKSRELITNKGFHLNEKVYAKMGNTYVFCTIIELSPNSLIIQYEDDKSKLISSATKYSMLFKINRSEDLTKAKYSVNETIVFKKDLANNNYDMPDGIVGKVICHGFEKLYLIEFYSSAELFRGIVPESMIVEKNEQ